MDDYGIRYYIQDENGNPVRCTDQELINKYRADRDSQRIAEDTIGEAWVSTVFLWMDHGFGGGPPILWETMVFGGEHSDYQERYTSRAEALEGHKRIVAMVRGDNN